MTNPVSLSKEERESGACFAPKFDDKGLLTCVVVDSHSRAVLVVAFMNAESLALTRQTGEVHFWSRSRSALWKKGETSGNVLKVVEMRVDCDQDALLIHAKPAGPICHTGEPSCFYRVVIADADDRVALVKVKT